MKIKLLLLTIVLTFFVGISDLFSQNKLYPNEFPLKDVKLLDGPFKHARDLNIQTLLQYNVDRLLAPYRKAAGLKPKAPSYPNWIGLDGHIGGHYLSAISMNYAATGNIECKKRLEYMISELKICQDSNAVKYPDWGVGYVGGVPDGNKIWPQIKAGHVEMIWKGWVPWYNVHKMFAGLRDAWLYAGNKEAKTMFLKFCDWAVNLTAGLSDAQMEDMLRDEYGGMNEVLADAYQMTGNKKYLYTAKRFSQKFLLNPLAAGHDILDNLHANTQSAKSVGFERVAEVSGDSTYVKAAAFYWSTVINHRTLALGGSGLQEFFPSAQKCIGYIHSVEGPETCNTYNMLKITEDLFRDHPLAKYADYYERALYNNILSAQNPDNGGYVYFTPTRPRSYRVYSAPNEAMWCCVGTGMEDHSKYNEFIYTHQNDSLYLNLFIASELNWEKKGIEIKQETSFPDEGKTMLVVIKGTAHFTLMVRYPSWVAPNLLRITVNGRDIPYVNKPSSYIAIARNWSAGDRVIVTLPMRNTIEQLPNVPDYFAFMHGPILLGAKTGTEDLAGLIAGDGRWGHIPSGKMLPLNKAPIIVTDHRSEIADKLIPVKNKPCFFTFRGLKIMNPVKNMELEPFYKIHDARYMMYWMVLSKAQYHHVVDSISSAEAKMLALAKRTVDFVQPGQQQPEVDHAMKFSNSSSGTFQNRFWRAAKDGGYFSYLLSTNGDRNLALIVTYRGNEFENQNIDIYIDGQKLVSKAGTKTAYQEKFVKVVYPIPYLMIKGKSHIRVKFQAPPQSASNAVYDIRLVREKKGAGI
ncbi:glycoside hydrolase family 127 protein [Microbacter margulisiae]|uniref:Glycosyl hydrolase n=1 Tax=Microbacter margulisiae TaxID=1350067 RepID=A0A7W5DST4_9PORP|nr:beta-L-arabinofuranosidase domain-containing protein [Microbacter margulisiae]MBB3188115.1 hypothetical protein [Microbacter margulisiae]